MRTKFIIIGGVFALLSGLGLWASHKDHGNSRIWAFASGIWAFIALVLPFAVPMEEGHTYRIESGKPVLIQQ